MPRISALCLSDMHFGSEASLLTAVDPQTQRPDLERTSPVLASFAECLKTILSWNEAPRKPRLILAGDVLELALATDNVAATVFARFARLLFDGRELPVDPSIVYVPGNHDHHLWETARESQYAAYLEEPGIALPLRNEPWHCTPLFPWRPEQNVANRDVESRLLTTLLRWCDPPTGARVVTMYPNFGIMSGDGESSCAVVHHGHFAESIYYLMTDLAMAVFPGRARQPYHIWDLEIENYAWIDFLWGTLGRSGSIGETFGLVYNMLKSPKAKKRLMKDLTEAITARASQGYASRWMTRLVVASALRRLLGSVGELERGVEDWPLGDESWRRLDQYLGRYVRGQLERECPGGAPPGLAFVFGHTHKPFEGERRVPSLGAPVRLYNMGGWVVESSAPSPRRGAAVVLVDEAGHAASIRLYNETPDHAPCPVRVASAEDEGAPNPLRDELRRLIDADRAPWRDFSETAAEALSQRHAYMETVINSSME